MVRQFDYIVVGAGSAGCVVANRLSGEGASVLLLEAGGPGDWANIRVPAFIDSLLDSPVDWGYRTTPQEQLLGRKIFLSRGKCLGGTSAINAMVYMRGNCGDYDHWRELGNRGWGYEDVLPYFMKSEANQSLGGRFHGTSGPLVVSSFNTGSRIHELFLQGAQEIGLPYNPDVNGETQEGYGPFQATIGPMGRCSTAVAFLHPVMDRKNLQIATNATVTRLVVEGSRISGVDYLHMGEKKTVHANEIILCGGALNSPQLLMLSGIGPEKELRTHGIDTKLDLPGVGQNLQDHVQVATRFEVVDPVTVFGLSPEQSNKALKQCTDEGLGPYHTNMCEAGAFVRCNQTAAYPDVQIHCESYFSPHYFDGTPADRHGFGLIMNVCRPKSRGEVRLNSADPLDRPVIDPRYLSDPDDLNVSVEGVKTCLEIGNSTSFGKIGTRRAKSDLSVKNETEIADFICRAATTIWHPVGTCKMGSDPLAVVDDQLQVHGIANLRVADASIMPTLVSGNTNAPCIMIGEKAADLILARSRTSP
jgi:choline dehydrogenase